MTPPRLSQIECPQCHTTKWIIDCDYQGADLCGGIEEAYPERVYDCSVCRRDLRGWLVRQQAPPEFLLQPHDLYPMTRAEFDRWVAILKTNFPDHPALAALGSTFFPRTPEEVAAKRNAFEDENPVGEIRDQDGARRRDPSLRDAEAWVDSMRPGETLSFLRRDGGVLAVTMPTAGTFSIRCADAVGQVLHHASNHDAAYVLRAVTQYVRGDLSLCHER